MKKLTVALAASIAALTAAALAQGAGTKAVWTAALSSGQEVPPQAVKTPNAHGLFKATLTGTSLKWKLTFAKLSGPANAAHIHMAAKGKSGPIVVSLCGPCTSGQTGTATLTTAELTAFKEAPALRQRPHHQEPRGRNPRPTRRRLTTPDSRCRCSGARKRPHRHGRKRSGEPGYS